MLLLNDILLDGFLFIVYLSIFSWIYTNQENYQPFVSTKTKDFSQPINYFPEEEEEKLTDESSQIYCLLKDAPTSLSQEQNSQPINPIKETANNSNLPEKNSSYDKIQEVIKTLTKRQSRKLCKPLSIQQKCNGVEKTTQLMRAEISRKFKDNPQLVISVIEEKLPDILAKLFSNPSEINLKSAI